MNCSFCHTTFPELNAAGRKFKLLGYVSTEGRGEGAKVTKAGDGNDMEVLSSAPIGAAIQISDSFISAQTTSYTASAGNDTRGTLQLPASASLFYAGAIGSKAGAFVQFTYDSNSGTMHLDTMTDVRYADLVKLGDTELIYGLTANSGPTMSDVWNSVPVWGFPYAGSTLTPMPAAVAQVDNAATGNLGGLGAYLYWNNLLYLEAAGYRSNPQGAVSYGAIQGVAPYWRAALQHEFGDHSLELGGYGYKVSSYPSGALTQGTSDSFTDVALDAQYQYVTDNHLISVQATAIKEYQARDYSRAQGTSANPSDNLATYRANASYYFLGKIGAAAGYFDTEGDADAMLYAPSAVMGSANGSPRTQGAVYEINYFPAANAKLSAQYKSYAAFNGRSSNYDGAGRNAWDNNTLMLLGWLAY